MTAGAIEAVRFKATRRPHHDARRPVRFGGWARDLADRAQEPFRRRPAAGAARAQVLANYRGPVAVMSFDPAMIEVVRWIAPHLTRGIVAEAITRIMSGTASRARKSTAWPAPACHPHPPAFIAYGVKDLPAAAPLIARTIFRLPLLTWTVRSDADRRTRGALGGPDDIRGHPSLMAEGMINFERFPA